MADPEDNEPGKARAKNLAFVFVCVALILIFVAYLKHRRQNYFINLYEDVPDYERGPVDFAEQQARGFTAAFMTGEIDDARKRMSVEFRRGWSRDEMQEALDAMPEIFRARDVNNGTALGAGPWTLHLRLRHRYHVPEDKRPPGYDDEYRAVVEVQRVGEAEALDLSQFEVTKFRIESGAP